MASIDLSDAMNDFDRLLALAQDQPVQVRDGNRDLAVVVSAEEYRRLVAAARAASPLVMELFRKSVIEHGNVYKALARWEAEHPEPTQDSS